MDFIACMKFINTLLFKSTKAAFMCSRAIFTDKKKQKTSHNKRRVIVSLQKFIKKHTHTTQIAGHDEQIEHMTVKKKHMTVSHLGWMWTRPPYLFN